MKLLRALGAVKLLLFTSSVLQSFSSLTSHSDRAASLDTGSMCLSTYHKSKIVFEEDLPSISFKRLEFILGFAFP